MDAVGFPLWDAPGFGSPWLGGVRSEWRDSELHTVTLARCRDETRDDLADISVSTSKPGWSTTPHLALAVGALLSFSPRLMSTGGMTAREAAETLAGLSRGAGRSTSLTVAGRVVEAGRFDVPVTGDGVVTAVDPPLAVWAAGREALPVPALETADLTPWNAPLGEQVAHARARR
ncbi:hypothetical protein [Actinoplanes subtropicus]|uniref:hypothetical protein n=1 Tax=Actinoplanes subtropicus TaxID=543632 RepID=UPI0012F92E76|nr:hypothetical protein [Actinoplanes subtropicus]